MSDIMDALAGLSEKAKEGNTVDDLKDAVGRLQDQFQGWNDGLAAIRSRSYEGTAADEQVVAEVDGRGALMRLEIGPYAMRDLDASGLAQACTEAIIAARTTLSEAMLDHVATVSGEPVDLTTPVETDPRQLWRNLKETLRWNG